MKKLINNQIEARVKFQGTDEEHLLTTLHDKTKMVEIFLKSLRDEGQCRGQVSVWLLFGNFRMQVRSNEDLPPALILNVWNYIDLMPQYLILDSRIENKKRGGGCVSC